MFALMSHQSAAFASLLREFNWSCSDLQIVLPEVKPGAGEWSRLQIQSDYLKNVTNSDFCLGSEELTFAPNGDRVQLVLIYHPASQGFLSGRSYL